MIGLPVTPGIFLAGSLTAGLIFSPFIQIPPLVPGAGAGFALLALGVLARRRLGAAVHLAVALVGLCAGLWLGELRLEAIDNGAFAAQPGEPVTFRGHLSEPPRQHRAGGRLYLAGAKGRVAVLTDRLPRWAATGAGAEVRGRAEAPPDWLADDLRRRGSVVVIRAERIRPLPPRTGLQGLLDGIRERALAGIQAGMPVREAALAAGFVLGQDEDIDPVTEENFRRSGLSHLLAVSGQNVMLLILLGSLPLVVAGVHLRHRVWPLALLVLLYLPLTGAGPSIQRATVMGLVMLLMLWLGDPGQRFFALLAAAALTLLANPRVSGDIGWQLSFAATLAIMVMAPGLRRLLRGAVAIQRLGPIGLHLADGISVTVAATIATAPLMAHHFGALPLGTVSANLLALPAVAPVMWLGMVAGIAGQLPGVPTEALNLVSSVLIAYIAWVAELIGSLEAGVLKAEMEPAWLVALGEVAVLALGWLLSAWLKPGDARPPRRARGGPGGAERPWTVRLVFALMVAAVALPAAAALAPGWLLGETRGPPDGLRIVALDVGQGDAILIQRRELNLLVDTGPPGAGVARALARYGVGELDGAFITHADLDHVGGLEEVAGDFPVKRLLFGDPPPGTGSIRHGALAAGDRIRFGDLVIDVLWPPPLDSPPAADDDRNRRSLVLLLRWHGFKALLPGDAEAEQTSYPVPDVDLLKVAHHGSADDGLPALLDAASPELALISVGEGNGYGHPAPQTLTALAEESVAVHRTDREGDLVLELEPFSR